VTNEIEHVVLQPQLETGNFIIKTIWLPGSQSQLVLVTADFVKIYDLAKDTISPANYILLPCGKIRDCTFVFPHCDGTVGDQKSHQRAYIVIMTASGYIYSQELNEETSASNGPFYVTNVIDVTHPDLTVCELLNYWNYSLFCEA
jgi:E3 ubiquitin-protein ligase UBR4